MLGRMSGSAFTFSTATLAAESHSNWSGDPNAPVCANKPKSVTSEGTCAIYK